jgi:hypothetical protein
MTKLGLLNPPPFIKFIFSFLFLLTTPALAETIDGVLVSYEWDRPVRTLPAADRFMRGVASLSGKAERLFREVYNGDKDAFFHAVRQSRIRDTGKFEDENPPPKPESDQASGKETNGLSDPTVDRYEMTLVEEEIREADGTKRLIKNVAIKFAPAESMFDGETLKRDGIRIVVYNVAPWLGSERVNPQNDLANAYHAKILRKVDRNVLWLDMDGGRVTSGGFIEKEPFIKDGELNAQAWWKKYWQSVYVKPNKAAKLTALGSSLIQAGISYDIMNAVSPDSFNIDGAIAAIATFIYSATLCTYGKTYGNIVANEDINIEAGMRYLLGIPLTVSLAIISQPDWNNPMSYVSIFFISFGDKIASAFFSFIPMARERSGATFGKKAFGIFNQAITEREFSAWVRMAIQQLGFAMAVASNGHADGIYKYLGNVLVWALIPVAGKLGINYARRNMEKYPLLEKEMKRLQTWMNPKTYVQNAYRETKTLCKTILGFFGMQKASTTLQPSSKSG